MQVAKQDDLSVIHIQEAPALWTVLPALFYKEASRCLESRSEVVHLKDCILFAWCPDRLRRAYEELDRAAPTGELMRVVEYRVGEARYYVPDTDMHYAVALHRRGGEVLRVNVQSVYDLSPGAFAIEDAGVLWKLCDDRRTWEQVWRYDARLVSAFRALGVGRFTY